MNPVLALDYFAEWVCAENNYAAYALKLNNILSLSDTLQGELLIN